jgi:dTDP-4-amino-4,6-dideoxygalactose transaminase
VTQRIPPKIYLSPPHMGADERALLLDAFDSNWVAPLGPHVDAFERELAAHVGVGHAAALSSGTAALHLALLLVGVKPGDTVLTSTLTFAATANAITYAGATPVFIDSDASTWNMSPALLAEELESAAKQGKRPAAVLVVDLYGQCADWDPITEVCARYDVPLIEDAAEALGATYQGKSAGTFGAAAAFSFNGNKIITTSGGGMLVSAHEDLVTRARFLATQARDPAPHYQHSHIGHNYRLSNLLAAVGRGQLRVLSDRVRRRRQNRVAYEALLGQVAGLTFPVEAPYGQSNAWLTCMLVNPDAFGATREEIRVHLEQAGIEARPLWKPMHLQPVFRSCRAVGGDVAARLFDVGLCLPSGSSLLPEQLELVVEKVLSTPRKVAR